MFFCKKVCSSTVSCFWLGYIFLCKRVGPELSINLKAYTLKSVPCMFFVFLIFCICLMQILMHLFDA